MSSNGERHGNVSGDSNRQYFSVCVCARVCVEWERTNGQTCHHMLHMMDGSFRLLQKFM